MERSNCKLYDLEANKVAEGIRVAECMALFPDYESDKQVEEEISFDVKDLTVSNILNCSYCNVSFNNVSEQRNHFKLDWHRYNLKRALSNKEPICEDDFDNLADDISSISGSDIENSDKENSSSESSDQLDKKTFDKIHTQKYSKNRHSKAFFENSEGKVFSVYKCLLHSKRETVTNAVLLSLMSDLLTSPKKWLLIMLGGGHFAAAIFNNGVIAEHKTFHCYTVRAKQGGSQSSRDNRGGQHAKSAGASLRRYNEQALVQHVQEIIKAWSESVKKCNLILYRAAGSYNRGVLFGGKSPPLEKNDHRLRNIPFPTRRATFNEVKRVHDILSTVEIYGSAENYKNKYPRSINKRDISRKSNLKSNESAVSASESSFSQDEKKKKSKASRKIDRSKPRSSPDREIPGKHLQSSSESISCSTDEVVKDNILITTYVDLPLNDLKEFDDTISENKRNSNREDLEKKSKNMLSKTRKKKTGKSAFDRQFESIQKKLVTSCENADKNLLEDTLKIYDTLPDEDTESIKGVSMTKKDFINCLNSGVNNETKNTPLHLSALMCLPEFITLLLHAGADPTVKNKNRLTPYVISGNKETRNSFKEFVSLYPDKYEYKKANIPEPLTECMQKIYDEKKREKNRMKRMKDKIKKKENREKQEEEKERQRFLQLSDREKCALAAERRIIASATANLRSAKPPVLSRCFQCGVDITGKVPFEYGINRFCTVSCVKSHRLKTNSYGLQI